MKLIVLGMTILTVLTAPVLAYGQEDTEVGKLKQRLMALEQKIYSSSTSSGGTMLADLEARMGGLEEESQKVYGAVEELGYSVDEFAKKMDLIAKDFDLRLTDLEGSIEKLKKQSFVAPAVKHSENKAVKAKLESADKKTSSKNKKSAKSSPSIIPTAISAEDLYGKAYNFLVATSYTDSEKWMKEFIKRHPSHDLADNAHYWLGEIYLVQEQPQKAVVSFSTGLSKFPKGAKAPANLLKMGSAFKQMGKKDFAESSWKKLIKDFEGSPEADKAEKALEEMKVKG